MPQKSNRKYFKLNKDKQAIRRKSWLRIVKNFLLKGPVAWRKRKAGRVWNYVADFFQLTIHYELFTQSASVVYYLLLAFFPFLILVMYFTAIFSQNINISTETVEAAQKLLPAPVLDSISYLTQNITTPLSVLSLTVSTLTALWASSRGIGQILRSVTMIYPRKPKGITVPVRIMGIIGTIIIFILFGLTNLIMSFGRALFNLLSNFLSFLHFNLYAFDLLTYGLGLFLIGMIVYALYYISSHHSAEKMPILPGVVFSSFSWVALSYLYSIYISNKANLTSLYGGLANIIILMLWLNFSVQIILYGAVLNYQIAWYKIQKKDHYLVLNETIKEISEHTNPFDFLKDEYLKSEQKMSKKPKKIKKPKKPKIPKKAKKSRVKKNKIKKLNTQNYTEEKM